MSLDLGCAVALIVVSDAAGEQNSDNLSLPGTGSKRAHGPAPSELPKQAYGTNPVVLQAPSGKLTDSKYKKPIDDTVASLKKAAHVIRVVSPLDARARARSARTRRSATSR